MLIPEIPELKSPGRLTEMFTQDNARERFDRENALLQMFGLTPDIVFIGDSLTQEWPLSSLLRDKFSLIVNRGVGGDCAKHLPLRLEADALQLRPRAVHLLIGTNDIAYRFGYDSTESLVNEYSMRMTAILEALTGSGAQIFVGTLTPQRQEFLRDVQYERKTEVIPLFNRFLRQISIEMNVSLVDYHPHFYDEKGQLREELYVDGVHFNARGYYVMTRVLRDALTENLLCYANGYNALNLDSITR